VNDLPGKSVPPSRDMLNSSCCVIRSWIVNNQRFGEIISTSTYALHVMSLSFSMMYFENHQPLQDFI
jgi:hypothetical protein